MKFREIILIAAIIGISIFLYSKKKKEKTKVVEDESEVSETVAQKPEPKPLVTAQPVSSDVSHPVAEASAPANENLAIKFSAHLASMAKCLALVNVPPATDKVDPTPDNLVNNLRASLGDTVVQLDDWSQTEVFEKNGEKRRIRVDYDYPDGVTPNRRLSMYVINSYGMPEIMSLTEDEMNNPNESYIDSLKDGLKINSEERAARIYYSQGEELTFSIRNGKLQTLSIAKGNHYFNCANLDEDTSSCTCP